MMRQFGVTAYVVVSVVGLQLACAPRIPRDALAIRPQTIEFRQRSTRRFFTTDEKQILAACAGLLQDLGYTIESSETDLGLIVASSDRSAVEGGQVAGKIVWAIFFGGDIPIDHVQKFRASIVTKPDGSEIAVRVTFQRTVWNDHGQISKLEPIEDPELYQQFFRKLSQAVFLEAHEL